MALKIRILGSGPSSGVPSLKCRLHGGCAVCSTVKRTNISILVSKIDEGTQTPTVLVDCGKHFYEQYNSYLDDLNLKQDTNFVPSGTKRTENSIGFDEMSEYEGVQAIRQDRKLMRNLMPELILTHPHADALAGIDTYLMMNDGPIRLFCNSHTYEVLKVSHSYYFRSPSKLGIRGYFKDIVILEDKKQFSVKNINIETYSMEHGAVQSMGFNFEDKLLYLSDCSEIREEQLNYFEQKHFEYLLIDCLALNGFNTGHLNLSDVKNYVEKIKPKKTILVGLSHEIPNVDHIDEFTVGFDGMELEI